MKRIMIAGLVLSALTLAAPPAYASHLTHVGGCSFTAGDAPAGGGQRTGLIDLEAIVYSESPAANPVSATFTCHVQVNGVAQPGAVVTASGAVVVAGGGVVTYTSDNAADIVQLCQAVTYTSASGGSETASECFDAYEVPPPIVWEIVWGTIVNCPVLAALAPGAGPVYVNSQGDVWVQGEGFLDCPPYGNVFGFPPNG